MTARYAVFGQPIAHSLSPRIHAAFAAALGMSLDYRAIECARARFQSTLAQFAAAGGRGANITLPLKSLAFALCTVLSARAERAGSVNTLTRAGDGWHGDSTDGSGLLRDLVERHGFDLRGWRIVLLGAGGAAAAVAPALLDAGIAELVVVNRSQARAIALADRLADPTRVRAIRWSDLAGHAPVDLLIDATSAGHGAAALDLPASLVGPHSVGYCLSYGDAGSAFLAWARRAGANLVLDGLGMLVEQAAESFALWHGVRPDTGSVLTSLRHEPAAWSRS